MFKSVRLFVPISVIAFAATCRGAEPASPLIQPADQRLIEDVRSKRRDVADASWWGFDPVDATDMLQSAIDSGAKKVVVPCVGRPWITRPLKLRGRLDLEFQPGVVLVAKEGEFRDGGDSLLRAADAADIRVRGYGATLRMRKRDYQRPPYKKAEWRMGLRIEGCQRVRVAGLRIESSGGDGIYIGSTSAHRWCEDVELRDCVCHDNHRQGISVISAHKLLVENCVLSGTGGTPPEAGIDFEPDSPEDRLSECVVRNCVFENNAGHAILVYLKPLTSKSEPVSILFENCISRMGKPGMTPDQFVDPELRGGSGMSVGAVRDGGPKGIVEFRNCVAENTGREGAKIYDKASAGVRVRFVQCAWKNAWVSRHREYTGPRVPVLIQVRSGELTTRPGGVEFIDCRIDDDLAGPSIQFDDHLRKHRLHDVTGRITVSGDRLGPALLAPIRVDVTLKVERGQAPASNVGKASP